MTCEATKKIGDETILDVEVTANRPDWMSIVGVAREVAAIQGVPFRLPKINDLPKRQQNFPMDYKIDYEVLERWSAVIISDVTIKPSPDWMQHRLELVGLRPINNIVDITNYVMFELGIPMHAFDYDEIRGQIMVVEKAKGGEEFTTVDELIYKLPKDSMIIRDSERIIDLCGIKGGLNSGIKAATKNILIHSTIDNPVLTRRSSIAMGLRSDASAIYERGPDKGGTVQTLKRMAGLILELAGGKIASPLTDIKKDKFEPRNLSLSFKNLKRILGIKIPETEVVQILSRLNLSPKKNALGVNCTIPTYRGDIKIEEDLAEEVARIYGYNKFPTTIPTGKVAIQKIPYYFNDSLILKIKDLLTFSGYSETKNLSLISKELIIRFGMDPDESFRITNPVSLEYEYMRTSLIPSLVSAIKINTAEHLKLFEIDKVYLKIDKKAVEKYKVAGIYLGDNFRKFKTVIDLILSKLNIENYDIEFETDKPYLHQSNAGTIKLKGVTLGEFGEINPSVLATMEIPTKVFCFEMDVETLTKSAKTKLFSPLPTNPAQIEDLTLTFPEKTRIGLVVRTIISMNQFVKSVQLNDVYNAGGVSSSAYKNNYTFRIEYQNPDKTLTNEEAEKIRNEILTTLKSKFGASIRAADS